jgi:hypothetical protein
MRHRPPRLNQLAKHTQVHVCNDQCICEAHPDKAGHMVIAQVLGNHAACARRIRLAGTETGKR